MDTVRERDHWQAYGLAEGGVVRPPRRSTPLCKVRRCLTAASWRVSNAPGPAVPGLKTANNHAGGNTVTRINAFDRPFVFLPGDAARCSPTASAPINKPVSAASTLCQSPKGPATTYASTSPDRPAAGCLTISVWASISTPTNFANGFPLGGRARGGNDRSPGLPLSRRRRLWPPILPMPSNPRHSAVQ